MTGTDKCEVNAGDVFVVETPGGGGYGAAAEMRKAAE
jgi:N-methylhydantoinase B/oxoprolinase/acetone carboxylase alpha subunit